ncbi:unnamed protein product, partial [Closterium sp. Naga37s-1]
DSLLVTFRWQINGFSKLTERRVHSNTFLVGGYSCCWSLLRLLNWKSDGVHKRVVVPWHGKCCNTAAWLDQVHALCVDNLTNQFDRRNSVRRVGPVQCADVTTVCHVSACHPGCLAGLLPISSPAAVWSSRGVGEECSAATTGTGIGEMKLVHLMHCLLAPATSLLPAPPHHSHSTRTAPLPVHSSPAHSPPSGQGSKHKCTDVPITGSDTTEAAAAAAKGSQCSPLLSSFPFLPIPLASSFRLSYLPVPLHSSSAAACCCGPHPSVQQTRSEAQPLLLLADTVLASPPLCSSPSFLPTSSDFPHAFYAFLVLCSLPTSLLPLSVSPLLVVSIIPLPSPYVVVVPKHVTAVCHVSACHPARRVTTCLDIPLRLFDLLRQPCPLKYFSLGSVPILSRAAVWNKGGGEECSAVTVGTGMGEMVDLTHGRVAGVFEGACLGYIRLLTMHHLLPHVASCGPDCYLRIHHLHTQHLVAKVFLKQPPNFPSCQKGQPQGLLHQERKQ